MILSCVPRDPRAMSGCIGADARRMALRGREYFFAGWLLRRRAAGQGRSQRSAVPGFAVGAGIADRLATSVTVLDERMSRKKPAPDVIRGGYRFSEQGHAPGKKSEGARDTGGPGSSFACAVCAGSSASDPRTSTPRGIEALRTRETASPPVPPASRARCLRLAPRNPGGEYLLSSTGGRRIEPAGNLAAWAARGRATQRIRQATAPTLPGVPGPVPT